MLIGIVADIHDAVQPLARALAILRERGAQRIVTLGDAFETIEPGSPGPGVARLLAGVEAAGVWGNHDYALSHDVPNEVRKQADPALLAFSTRLQPQLVVEGCRFCHIEPWKDPFDLMDLWSFDSFPETPPDRYLVLVPAVLRGSCALFDTERSELTMIRCA
ncbi:MAG: metallophosphoesterase family protein [Bacteroidota bacterium]